MLFLALLERMKESLMLLKDAFFGNFKDFIATTFWLQIISFVNDGVSEPVAIINISIYFISIIDCGLYQFPRGKSPGISAPLIHIALLI